MYEQTKALELGAEIVVCTPVSISLLIYYTKFHNVFPLV